MMPEIDLTDEQNEVSTHPEAVFVNACPGSGKTRAVLARVANILEDIPSRKGVAVLSFTNTAVDEFIERSQKVGLDQIVRFPNFVGTFDAFIRHFLVLPYGVPNVNVRPTVLDSWSTLSVDIRLRGNNAHQGDGVSLDSFNPIDNSIEPASIGNAALRQHVENNQNQYVDSARRRRDGFKRRGIISAADARVIALEHLEKDGWDSALGSSLASRFSEVIVDEAQDCNPIDLAFLEWFREKAISTTLLCDPDQAIYGFRHGDPNDLDDFSNGYAVENRLSLTGNFRSSEVICRLAATLRSRVVPDDALGDCADVGLPIYLLEYRGATVPATVGEEFAALAERNHIPTGKTHILAHKRRAAFQAAGLKAAVDNTSKAKVTLIATAVGVYWSKASSTKEKETAVKVIEKILLEFMGCIDENEPLSRAIDRNSFEKRWLRRMAMDFVGSLPKSCDDTDEARQLWLVTLRETVDNLGVEPGEGISTGRFFRRPNSPVWSGLFEQSQIAQLQCATVHEAKGRQYEAVCLVIPPNRAPLNHTEQLLDAWETRREDEAKRVAYVAVTRAQKLLAIAISTNYRARLAAILDNAAAPYEVTVL